MPQASDELRRIIEGYFGDPIDDQGPTKFLKDCGHVLNRDWTWTLKMGETLESISIKEFHCISFLVDEWDFGGISGGYKENPANEA